MLKVQDRQKKDLSFWIDNDNSLRIGIVIRSATDDDIKKFQTAFDIFLSLGNEYYNELGGDLSL